MGYERKKSGYRRESSAYHRATYGERRLRLYRAAGSALADAQTALAQLNELDSEVTRMHDAILPEPTLEQVSQFQALAARHAAAVARVDAACELADSKMKAFKEADDLERN